MQKLELRQNQSQKLTPQQIQFIKLLQLSNSNIVIAGGEKNKWDYPLKVKIDLVYSHILNNYELKDSFSDWEILIRKH